eukprot:9511908-Karenia_brevis.AAC.1
MVWPRSLELTSWVTSLLKEQAVGMAWPKESGVDIPGHMIPKGVDSGKVWPKTLELVSWATW